MRNRWRIAGWGAAAVLLLAPLIAMQFTDEVRWTLSDFVFAGVLIGSIGAAFELVVRLTNNKTYRTVAGFFLILFFLLIWAGGAVGI